MPASSGHGSSTGAVRLPAVAGAFYAASRDGLTRHVDDLLAEAGRDAADLGATPTVDGEARPGPGPGAGPFPGILVPHAGLIYSGVVAAAGWRMLGGGRGEGPTTVVILGTNHSAAWLRGVGAWEAGVWRTPLGDVEVDGDLARAIVGLGPPFVVDRPAHLDEHSIEVQLPLLQAVAPETRIVPLAVSAGTGAEAIAAGERLGALLAIWGAEAGGRLRVAISSDMAHYPAEAACAGVTAALLPPLVDLDPIALARRERTLMTAGIRGLVCGMCGIEPAVFGLAALRAMGATRGVSLASATSADAGGAPDRSVGYLSVAFTRA
jgi:hypothetical protein